MFGPGGQAHSAAQQVQFNLTEKGIDFLGYKTLKGLLGSVGKSSFGAHDTPYLATGVEAEGVSKPYEFGDVLNLDVPATLTNAIAREGLGVPINIEYADLMVSQSEYRSSARDGADARLLPLDDPLRRGPVHPGQEGGARPHPPDPDPVPRRQPAGGAVPRLGGGDPAQRAGPGPGRALPHQHRRRAQAGPPDPAGAEEGHAADHHDHRREAVARSPCPTAGST